MAVTTSAVVGIAASGASAAQGFMAQAEASAAAQEARTAANRMMSDARKRAEVDNYAALSLPLAAYEAQLENNLAADRQAIEALQEGDSRALAAGVGRVGAQQAAEAESTRIAMGDEMFNVNKMKADSKENIKQQMVAMDVGEAKMQDQIAYEEEQRRAAGLQQGFAGIGQVAAGVGELAPLYGKSTGDRRAGKMMEDPAMKMRAELAGVDINDEAALFDWMSQQGITGKQVRNRNAAMTNMELAQKYESMFDI
tara:strand:+ start:9197 stop:9958 length:762 start_codon:yes stop_codon:yes gene_type:complete